MIKKTDDHVGDVEGPPSSTQHRVPARGLTPLVLAPGNAPSRAGSSLALPPPLIDPQPSGESERRPSKNIRVTTPLVRDRFKVSATLFQQGAPHASPQDQEPPNPSGGAPSSLGLRSHKRSWQYPFVADSGDSLDRQGGYGTVP